METSTNISAIVQWLRHWSEELSEVGSSPGGAAFYFAARRVRTPTSRTRHASWSATGRSGATRRSPTSRRATGRSAPRRTVQRGGIQRVARGESSVQQVERATGRSATGRTCDRAECDRADRRPTGRSRTRRREQRGGVREGGVQQAARKQRVGVQLVLPPAGIGCTPRTNGADARTPCRPERQHVARGARTGRATCCLGLIHLARSPATKNASHLPQETEKPRF